MCDIENLVQNYFIYIIGIEAFILVLVLKKNLLVVFTFIYFKK